MMNAARFDRLQPAPPGFNGEVADPLTGHYLLGNGYRAYNPVLMRFNSPDYLSPFGKGELNAYAYCAGDPINRVDPNGHIFGELRKQFRQWRLPRELELVPKETVWRGLAPGIYDAKVTQGGKTTHFIAGHGLDPTEIDIPGMGSTQHTYTPENLYQRLLNVDTTTQGTDEFHLISCHSASGDYSFAERFTWLSGKPTTGYAGFAEVNVDHMMQSAIYNGDSTIALGNNRYLYKHPIFVLTKDFNLPGSRFERYRFSLPPSLDHASRSSTIRNT